MKKSGEQKARTWHSGSLRLNQIGESRFTLQGLSSTMTMLEIRSTSRVNKFGMNKYDRDCAKSIQIMI